MPLFEIAIPSKHRQLFFEASTTFIQTTNSTHPTTTTLVILSKAKNLRILLLPLPLPFWAVIPEEVAFAFVSLVPKPSSRTQLPPKSRVSPTYAPILTTNSFKALPR